MWSRVYIVIVLGMVGYNGQELAVVRRRGRFLTSCCVLGQGYVCFWVVLVFIFGIVSYLAQPSLIPRPYRRSSSTTSPTPTRFVLLCTHSYDYSTIHPYRWIL
jgi:hypothetical protein